LQNSKARFRKPNRLLNAASYARVFKRARKSSDDFFSILWRPNGLPEARLGLAISKKHLRRAVDRNRTKRIVRESFRVHHDDLSGLDLVVLGRRQLQTAERAQLRCSLEKHWKKITEGAKNGSAPDKAPAQRNHYSP
jgi:ribonuclease P protein component